MTFNELEIMEPILRALSEKGYTTPTPIQEQAIIPALHNKDILGLAQTGTGKTAAFAIPIIQQLCSDRPLGKKREIRALILTPTRELAIQIDDSIREYNKYTRLRHTVIFGGVKQHAQVNTLKGGIDILVATPGRLLDLIGQGIITLQHIRHFVLDEADRMLDMGFHEDIMKIEKLLPKDRQTIMFSATMPPKIQQLAKTILRDPEEITIAIARPPETILQSAYICEEAQKIGIVKHLFKEKKPNKVLLFSGSKMKVKEIAKTLHHMGLSAGEMHSDLDQTQRNHVMHEFRNERVDILVATDIVSRGIDIDDITLVINFDVPYDVEDYVHRIGRTARAGDTGMAITFVAPDEQYRFSLIEKFLEKSIYRIPVPSELGEAPEYNPARDIRRRGAAARSGRKGGEKGGGRRNQRSSGRSGESERTSGEERAPRGKRSERPERSKRPRRPEGAEAAEGAENKQRADRPERSKGVNNPEGTENVERVERSERSEHPERSRKSKRSGKPRSQEGSRNEGESRAKEVSRQEGDATSPGASHGNEQSTGERQASRKKHTRQGQKPRARQEGTSKQGTSRSAEPRAPRERRSAEPSRKREGARDNRSKASTDTRGDAKKNAAASKGRAPSNKRVSKPTHPAPASKQEITSDKPKKKGWSWWPFGKK